MSAASPEVLLKAVHLATKKLSASSQIDAVLQEVLAICVQAANAEGGTIYVHNKERRTLEFRHVLPETSANILQFTDIPDDFGVAGKVFQCHRGEITTFSHSPQSQISEKTGVVVRSMATVPLTLENEEPFGVVQLINKTEGEFNDNDITVLETIGAVSTLAFLNSQLLAEQTRASQLLGMGRVAHDIKNMAFALEANVSFSDDTIDLAKEHAKELKDTTLDGYLDDVGMMIEELQGSIERIKRYSTLMSDLSAGKKLVPTLSVQNLAPTIHLSAAYMESDARKRNVELIYDIQEDALPTVIDEMYLFRVVQNLVSNAIKAVGESGVPGKVIVRYRFRDSQHVLEVEDTGPGMAREIADKILGGNAVSVWAKSSGSGWGTKIVLELTHAMGCEVSIDSELGKGSIFRVTCLHQDTVPD